MPAKKSTKAAEAQEPEWGYEEGIAQLEALVERMESGELSLEETLAAYERGAALHHRLEELLHSGQRRVEILQVREGEPDPLADWQAFEVEE